MRPARSKQSPDHAKPAARTVVPLRTTSERGSRPSPHYRFCARSDSRVGGGLRFRFPCVAGATPVGVRPNVPAPLTGQMGRPASWDAPASRDGSLAATPRLAPTLPHLRMRLQVCPVQLLAGCARHRMPIRRTRRDPPTTTIAGKSFQRPDGGRLRLRLSPRPRMRTSKALQLLERDRVDLPVSGHLGRFPTRFFVATHVGGPASWGFESRRSPHPAGLWRQKGCRAYGGSAGAARGLIKTQVRRRAWRLLLKPCSCLARRDPSRAVCSEEPRVPGPWPRPSGVPKAGLLQFPQTDHPGVGASAPLRGVGLSPWAYR
jgi:hypothetical protein